MPQRMEEYREEALEDSEGKCLAFEININTMQKSKNRFLKDSYIDRSKVVSLNEDTEE
jgi:hypothetical protein